MPYCIRETPAMTINGIMLFTAGVATMLAAFLRAAGAWS